MNTSEEEANDKIEEYANSNINDLNTINNIDDCKIGTSRRISSNNSINKRSESFELDENENNISINLDDSNQSSIKLTKISEFKSKLNLSSFNTIDKKENKEILNSKNQQNIKIINNYSECNDNLKLFNSPEYIKNPFRIGNLYSLLYFRHNPYIVLPKRIFRSILIVLILILVHKLLLNPIVSNSFIFSKLFLCFFYIFFIFGISYILLVNPGIPSRKNYLSQSVIESIHIYMEYSQSTEISYIICDKCNIYNSIEMNIYHCDDCNICVMDSYYHEEVIGKCISNKGKEVIYLVQISVIAYLNVLVGIFGMVVIEYIA